MKCVHGMVHVHITFLLKILEEAGIMLDAFNLLAYNYYAQYCTGIMNASLNFGSFILWANQLR